MTFCILYWFYLFIFTWHNNKQSMLRERECVCVFMKAYDTYVVLVQIKLPGPVQSLDWTE